MKKRIGGFVAGAVIIVSGCDYFYNPFLNRIDAPVVLTGADIPLAQGIDPATAEGYRWEDGAWVQVPIQIDERHVVDFGLPPFSNTNVGVVGTVYGSGDSGVEVLQYSDPNTFVGADPDPTFDADDEAAFMARDVGGQAPDGTTRPSGTSGPGLELEVTDPITSNVGYLYVFTGGTDPSAGLDYVDYDFSLDSGDYKTTYKRADGPNPESSTVTTAAYSLGFSDRWFHDSLAITDGGTGVDILDGHKSQFLIGFCGRSNVTFANAHGAFVANIDGPVRAIRSYIGANSGPLTQRTFHFYRDRYEITTDLRVHAIPSIMSFVDLSSAAIGMEYGNSEMAGTVTIDGTQDSVPNAVPDWSYLSGTQGNLLMAATIDATFSTTQNTFYLDDDDPSAGECWGDGDYLGASGVNLTDGIPNTDPRSSNNTFQSHEVLMPVTTAVDPALWSPVWQAAIANDVVVTSSVF